MAYEVVKYQCRDRVKSGEDNEVAGVLLDTNLDAIAT